jgi:integrase
MSDKIIPATGARMTPSPASCAELAPGEVGPLGLYLAGLSPGSRRSQLWRLNKAAALCDSFSQWRNLTYRQAVEIRGRAMELYAPCTASSIVSAVRSVAREAWRSGSMDGETYRQIASVPNVRGSSPPAGRWVSRPELRELFLCLDDGPIGARDSALLSLLFGAGLRRGELVALDRDDVETDAVVVRHGKGRKSRRVFLGASAQAGVARWLALVNDGPLFRHVDKGGRVTSSRISGEAVRRRILVLCSRADVPVFRPHDARRSYASNLLDLGVDLPVVSRLLGHASVQVTAGYDRRDERAETDAAALVFLPVGPAPSEQRSGSGDQGSPVTPEDARHEPAQT